VITIVLDPYAGVGLGGAFVIGLSSYRTAPVALGTLALYALLATGVTARWTKLLPAGAWLTIHRLGIVVFVMGWMHGLLAGTDSVALVSLYVVLGCAVGGAAAYRYWVTRQGRPAFHTSLPEGSR
jgi:sulfoxide reductase heme-binding subunit YedZ